jgi:hypothetical protein
VNPDLKKKQIPNYLTIPASIDKRDVARLCVELVGSVNGEDISLNGVPYVAGSLEFHGFAGALNPASGKYEGVHRFLPFHVEPHESYEGLGKWFYASDLPGLVEDETELLVEDAE